jgi:hypothetical protein
MLMQSKVSIHVETVALLALWLLITQKDKYGQTIVFALNVNHAVNGKSSVPVKLS